MPLEGGRVSQRVSTSGNRLGGTFWGRGGMPPVSEKNNSTLGGMCCMWDKACLAGFESHPQNCKSGFSGDTQDTFESCPPPSYKFPGVKKIQHLFNQNMNNTTLHNPSALHITRLPLIEAQPPHKPP